MHTLGAWSAGNVHARIRCLVAPPKRTAAAAEDVEHNAATLTESHDNQMAVWAALGIVSHLRGAIDCTLVRRYAPFLAAVHGPVLHVLVAAGLWILLRVEGIADLADCLDYVARVGRGGAACEEVVKGLALVRLERLILGTVFELGAHGDDGGRVEKRREGGPGYHGERGEGQELAGAADRTSDWAETGMTQSDGRRNGVGGQKTRMRSIDNLQVQAR